MMKSFLQSLLQSLHHLSIAEWYRFLFSLALYIFNLFPVSSFHLHFKAKIICGFDLSDNSDFLFSIIRTDEKPVSLYTRRSMRFAHIQLQKINEKIPFQRNKTDFYSMQKGEPLKMNTS